MAPEGSILTLLPHTLSNGPVTLDVTRECPSSLSQRVGTSPSHYEEVEPIVTVRQRIRIVGCGRDEREERKDGRRGTFYTWEVDSLLTEQISENGSTLSSRCESV